MSGENWTPGPWHVAECNCGAECWCRLIAAPNMDADECDRYVCPSGAIRKEDAHLIAAAPELYEALKWAVGILDGEFNGGFEDIHSVLRKARGE